MLFVHVVPSYFAARYIQQARSNEWHPRQRAGLWGMAIGSTIFPDFDVIHSILLHGVANHYYATLWTHSIFPYLAMTLLWLALRLTHRWAYVQHVLLLFAIGGFSHLLLDVIAHNTPLLFPFRLHMFGNAPLRIVQGGLWAYLTDPLLVLEFILLAAALLDIIYHARFSSATRAKMAVAVVATTATLLLLFIARLPSLRIAFGLG